MPCGIARRRYPEPTVNVVCVDGDPDANCNCGYFLPTNFIMRPRFFRCRSVSLLRLPANGFSRS